MAIDADSVFIYPTDTVWGIGGSIYSEKVYKKIAAIKKTSEDKPLSIMFSDIDQVMSSFLFPSSIDKRWLEIFFSLESTLGIPLKRAKIKIPSWVTAGSTFVSVRSLPNQHLKEIAKTLEAPFFTTSLNVTGHPPITTLEKAQRFQEEHAPNAFFVGGEEGVSLSGHSSTIIFLEDHSFSIIRAGNRIEDIKAHLNLKGFTTA